MSVSGKGAQGTVAVDEGLSLVKGPGVESTPELDLSSSSFGLSVSGAQVRALTRNFGNATESVTAFAAGRPVHAQIEPGEVRELRALMLGPIENAAHEYMTHRGLQITDPFNRAMVLGGTPVAIREAGVVRAMAEQWAAGRLAVLGREDGAPSLFAKAA